ncbi:MAG TPA: AMP-binding protein, partial [Polyangiaceae bacterium]|nr:AMP-binding protein [Polyangiaceae bacterium]
QLAYVIFTSGSTGEPKGVSLSQRALAVHVDDYVSTYGLSASDRVYQFSTINFDASAEQLFPALSVGACVVMRGVEVPEWTAFNAVLRDERVSVLDLPTSYWQQWLSELPLELPSLRLVTVGGEALSAPALARWKRSPLSSVRLDNSYGPTEAAIAALFHATVDEDAWRATVPIGRPYPGRTVRLLDSSGRDVVTGALGELCIGGDSLARCYEHRPVLTADRFVPDANRPGARLYRTGDICRRRDDGTLEFLGRRDAQVKLRGHRIELAEVERTLALVSGVQAAAAVVRGVQGRERLVAYVVGDVDKQAVLRAVRERLPSYMVPSSLHLLEALPLRANGKVDLDALPDPALSNDGEQLEPRTELERRLLEVWASVLGVTKIGVNDNFFALGGDSISSLLVVSRARALGFQITPKQIFERPTIAELALVVGRAAAERAQETHESLALSPIQAWFFEQHPQGEAHYNQSVLLRIESPFSVRALGEALRALLIEHDSLRLRFSCEGGTWRQRVVGPEDPGVAPAVLELDLRTEADWPARLRVEAELLQRGLSLESGPLFRAAYFQVPGDAGRLLLVAHHLVIDGVSWRILLERLEDAYQQAVRGAQISLPPTCTPWSVWAQKLVTY